MHWTPLTIGCIFRFCTASLSFFHDGIFFNFSLRSACSSNIGLNKKISNSSNIWRHDQTHRGSIFTGLSYFADSVIFAVAAFFSSSAFVISFPCFPAFFHGGRIESVGLWAAIFLEDIFQTSPRLRCCRSSARNSFVWREYKARALHHHKPIRIVQFSNFTCSRLLFTKYGILIIPLISFSRRHGGEGDRFRRRIVYVQFVASTTGF